MAAEVNPETFGEIVLARDEFKAVKLRRAGDQVLNFFAPARVPLADQIRKRLAGQFAHRAAEPGRERVVQAENFSVRIQNRQAAGEPGGVGQRRRWRDGRAWLNHRV